MKLLTILKPYVWMIGALFLATTSLNGTGHKSIEGVFKISSITQGKKGKFQICVDSTKQKNKTLQTYCIISSNLHRAIEKGASYKVKGLLAKESKGKGIPGILSQLVVFLPSEKGDIPIWIMSESYKPDEIGNFLEQHNPQTDYMVF